MKNPFKDSVILITGGASGIGKSLAKQLGSLGARVIIADRNKMKGQDESFVHIDMTDERKVEKMISDVIKKYGRLDYIFNNAGIFMGGEIRDTPLKNWRKTVDNNIWAVNNGTYFAYQAMLKQGSGHIVNVASAAGLFPVPGMGIYGSSKFAIVGLSHGLRNEAKTFGIKVSVVCPTVVDTPLYDTAIYNRVDAEKALKNRSKLQTPEQAARKIVVGVIKNKATIHTSISTKLTWWVYRFIPAVYNIFTQRVLRAYREKLRRN